jgi:colicin import membrane protein
MQAATIEAARIEVERRAQIARILQEQDHERALARIAADRQKKRLQRVLLGGGLAAALAIGGGLGGYFGVIKPSVDAELALTQRAIQDEEAKAKALEDQLRRQAQREAELRGEIAAVKVAPPVKPELPPKPAPVAVVKPRPAPADPARPCTCLPGDPMCGCIR